MHKSEQIVQNNYYLVDLILKASSSTIEHGIGDDSAILLSKPKRWEAYVTSNLHMNAH